MVLFIFTLSGKKKNPSRPALIVSAIRLEPLPTQLRSHVRVIHSQFVFLSHSHTHTRAHTRTLVCHNTPWQTAVMGDFWWHCQDIVSQQHHGNAAYRRNKGAKAALQQSELSSAIARTECYVRKVHISAYQYDRTLKG